MAYAHTPRPHIVRVPRHMILLRFFQIFVAALILGLTAYGVHVLTASGIVLTLVTGRPLPPSFSADSFQTQPHSTNSTNSTFTFISLITNSSTTFLNSTSVGSKEGLKGVGKRDYQYSFHADLNRTLWHEDIPYNKMDMKKLCPSPAYLGAPNEAYPIYPPSSTSGPVPSVPSPLSDWHADLRGHGRFSGIAKRVVQKWQDMRDWGEGNMKNMKDTDHWSGIKGYIKDDLYMHTHGYNPWGTPLNRSLILLPPGTLMWGHLQTAILTVLHLLVTLLTTNCSTFANYYDYPLLLTLEFFLLMLWVISFCVLAAQVALAQAIGYGTACGEDGYCYTYASWDKRRHFLQLMACAAALSAIMFILYLVSFSIFTSSVLKHRREGGKTKPLSPEDSHPGPFPFDETREVDSHPSLNRHEGTDEEAGRKSKKQSKEEKKAAKDVKEAEKEDRRAIRNMKRGGGWKREGVAEPKRPKTHSRLSLHGFEGKQMQMARSRDIGEMEPAMGAPYVRGG